MKAGNPAVTAAVTDVVDRPQRIDGVRNIESPLGPVSQMTQIRLGLAVAILIDATIFRTVLAAGRR